MNEFLPWLILFLPLVSAVLITLFTRRHPALSAALSIGAILGSFALVVALAVSSSTWLPEKELTANWLSVGGLRVDFGIRFDALSLLMLLVVTGVGSAIHIYSWGYMRKDRSVSRFFAGLSLFSFSMLGIVLSTNLLQMFIFWELVGVSSYLLIGFWFEKPAAADAAKKAFITNRLGDFGFLLGVLMVWTLFGSLSFDGIKPGLAEFMGRQSGPNPLFLLVGLLLFCGAVGKSAQFPLHVWLPDAMEGPTPVSALIHAATMVAAGVYMLCRVFFIIEPSGALPVIAWIGGITALLAAVIALQQNDIKRILAYSTLSQLGYMVMAVGLAAPGAAMFHLTTHAFFKALLFLGAGSIIMALHHEQDIWKMGALWRKMPVTFWTFLAGTLALCGVPPLSGFYSKDAILAAAASPEHGSLPLFILGVTVAVLTTFYMFRLVFVVFYGRARSDASGHAHESPAVMTLPLLVLAALSVIGGFIGIEACLGRAFPVHGEAMSSSFFQALFAPFAHSMKAAAFGLFAVMAGLGLAWKCYAKAATDPLPVRLGVLGRWMQNRFYFDELYAWLIAATHESLARLVVFIDRWIIAGLCVRGVHGTTEFCGRALRLLQTGSLQTYALLFVIGLALLLYLTLFK